MYKCRFFGENGPDGNDRLKVLPVKGRSNVETMTCVAEGASEYSCICLKVPGDNFTKLLTIRIFVISILRH